ANCVEIKLRPDTCQPLTLFSTPGRAIYFYADNGRVPTSYVTMSRQHASHPEPTPPPLCADPLDSLAERLADRLASRIAPAAAVVPLLLSQTEAMAFVGLKRTSWFEAKAAGELPPHVIINGVPMWRRSDLEAWAARLKPGRGRRAPR